MHKKRVIKTVKSAKKDHKCTELSAGAVELCAADQYSSNNIDIIGLYETLLDDSINKTDIPTLLHSGYLPPLKK